MVKITTTKAIADYHWLEGHIIDWGADRQIIQNSSPETQLLKAISEIGELSDAQIKGDENGIKDAIGDVVVCLIMYCSIKGIHLSNCLAGAYEEIKDRKGKLLPNGTFVKEKVKDHIKVQMDMTCDRCGAGDRDLYYDENALPLCEKCIKKEK